MKMKNEKNKEKRKEERKRKKSNNKRRMKLETGGRKKNFCPGIGYLPFPPC